jgi:hypothetical protein
MTGLIPSSVTAEDSEVWAFLFFELLIRSRMRKFCGNQKIVLGPFFAVNNSDMKILRDLLTNNIERRDLDSFDKILRVFA